MVQQRARLGLRNSRLWNIMKDAHVFGCLLYWLRLPLPPESLDCPPMQTEEILRGVMKELGYLSGEREWIRKRRQQKSTDLSVICSLRINLSKKLYFFKLWRCRCVPYTANEGQWEFNINVWFRFTVQYVSQKWNCTALLFPKQNYNVPSPNATFHFHWVIYIFPWSVCRGPIVGI